MSLNIWEPRWVSLRKAGYGELQTEKLETGSPVLGLAETQA